MIYFKLSFPNSILGDTVNVASRMESTGEGSFNYLYIALCLFLYCQGNQKLEVIIFLEANDIFT